MPSRGEVVAGCRHASPSRHTCHEFMTSLFKLHFLTDGQMGGGGVMYSFSLHLIVVHKFHGGGVCT